VERVKKRLGEKGVEKGGRKRGRRFL